MYYIS